MVIQSKGDKMTDVMTAVQVVPATDRQISYIKDLIRTRQIPESLQGTDFIEVAQGSKKAASSMITWLTGLPKGQARKVEVVSTTEVFAPTYEIPFGFFTVADGEGGWVTLRIKKENWADGKAVVSYLSGSDNTVAYTAFGFVTEAGVKPWARFKTSHGRIVAAAEFLVTGDVDAARKEFLNVAEARAMASGRCACCGRMLTVPASVHRGLGPECARKYL